MVIGTIMLVLLWVVIAIFALGGVWQIIKSASR